MSRRKAYKPKPITQNPLNFYFGGLKRPDAEHITEVNLKNHMAMANICKGEGTRDDWDRLVGMVNMALVIAEMYFDLAYHAELIEGRDALHNVGCRYMQRDRFGFAGDERNALNRIFEIHEAQLEALRIVDIERAYQEVERRVRHRINTKPVAKKIPA